MVNDQVSVSLWMLLPVVLRHPRLYRVGSGIKLRAYQKVVAAAVTDSVIRRRGLTFVVIFPRQSGKNELQAQIEAYLLALFQERDAEIVKVSPLPGRKRPMQCAGWNGF